MSEILALAVERPSLQDLEEVGDYIVVNPFFLLPSVFWLIGGISLSLLFVADHLVKKAFNFLVI